MAPAAIWAAAGVGAVAAAVFTVVAVIADLDTADRVASVVAAVLAAVGTVMALVSGAASSGARRVRVRRSGVSAENITRSAIGKNSTVIGPYSAPSGGGNGDITDSAIGDDSTRR